jgi:2,4-dienoyl-CoA reductase-like NADH-dependent reductase (Old Yellow Enzyme family)
MNFDSTYSPFKLRTLLLRNRFIKTATYEGMYRDGMPLPALTAHHARLAEGGVALTTVAYGAVNADGRTNSEQMYMREEVIPELKKLTSAVHSYGGAASLQLTHCGFFTKNREVTGKKPVSPSRMLNLYGFMDGLFFSRAMNEGDLQQVTEDFGRAARMAVTAGFDAVEIHMGHGYLLSQFLSPEVNHRKDRYGGTLENMLRFPLEVVATVRKALGEDFPVLCKMNLSDDFKGGLTVDEAVEVARSLEKAGVDALVLSGGYTSKTPFFLMRGDIPLKEMISVEKNMTQKITLLLFGRIIIKKYDFTENFFLPLARKIRSAVAVPLVYVGGVVSRQGVDALMHEGFDLIAIGRALIHDPDFIMKIRNDDRYISPCNHCNICVAEMEREGVKCVL